jgi:hypothetical protein
VPEGIQNLDSHPDQRFPYHPAMLFLLSLIVRALARLPVGERRNDGAQDLEILVLRHQLRVLRRKTGRPKLKPLDRMLLASGVSTG